MAQADPCLAPEWSSSSIAHKSDAISRPALAPTGTPSLHSSPSPSNLKMPASKRLPRNAAATMRNSTLLPAVKRFDCQSRASWDSLRRDNELFLDDGDCFVHLYAKGQSRRGPAFCIPRQALRAAHCTALFHLVTAEASPDRSTAQWHLHIPAPATYSRQDAFQYHLTTRNFFAYLVGKPLVGVKLSRALIDLRSRLELYCDTTVDVSERTKSYFEEVGYLDFAHCADHALALLVYAEHFHERELWIDAFAHCVGMNEELCNSEEYKSASRRSQTKITKTFLEVEVHLDRVQQAMSTFLETELSSTHIGLGQGPRDHLDRFRSFLHGYYMQKYGYWPPMRTKRIDRAMYTAMYQDFQHLYDYLADTDSTESIQDQKPVDGGICVLQTVQAFNKTHRFTESLPHPLPLIPATARPRSSSRRQSLSARINGTKKAKQEAEVQWKTLLHASNSDDTEMMGSPFICAYMRLERDCCDRNEERVSAADARKVRWLLVYGMLQMLAHAVRPPKEVRNSENVEYTLSCVTTPSPPWESRDQSCTTSEASSGSYAPSSIALSEHGAMSFVESPPAIEPDCDGSEYFSADRCTPGATSSKNPVSKTASAVLEMPSPLRLNAASNLLRGSSVRSIRRLSLPAFSRRDSIKVQSNPPPPDESLLRAYEHARLEALDFGSCNNVSEFTISTEDSVERPDTSGTVLPETEARARPLTISLNMQSEMNQDDAMDSPITTSSGVSRTSSPMFSPASGTGSPASSVGSIRRDSTFSNDAEQDKKPTGEEPILPPRLQTRRHSTSSSVYSLTAPKTPNTGAAPSAMNDYGLAYTSDISVPALTPTEVTPPTSAMQTHQEIAGSSVNLTFSPLQHLSVRPTPSQTPEPETQFLAPPAIQPRSQRRLIHTRAPQALPRSARRAAQTAAWEAAASPPSSPSFPAFEYTTKTITTTTVSPTVTKTTPIVPPRRSSKRETSHSPMPRVVKKEKSAQTICESFACGEAEGVDGKEEKEPEKTKKTKRKSLFAGINISRTDLPTMPSLKGLKLGKA